MAVNLNQPILGRKGKPLSVDGSDSTLGDFLYSAVAMNKEGARDVASQRKATILLNKVAGSGEVEFSKEELEQLTTICAQFYTVGFFAPIDAILNPKG